MTLESKPVREVFSYVHAIFPVMGPRVLVDLGPRDLELSAAAALYWPSLKAWAFEVGRKGEIAPVWSATIAAVGSDLNPRQAVAGTLQQHDAPVICRQPTRSGRAVRTIRACSVIPAI